MAMFPTHIKTSTALGIGYGVVAHVGYGVPLTTSVVAASLCSISGMLPDIDSGPGIPVREITTFLASALPVLLITRLLSYSFTQETLVLTGAVIYVSIRFGLSYFLHHYTVHRGMFHSFPSMAIFGEFTYLLFYGESTAVRLFMVAAVCLGFFSHLLLDELYSVEWDGRPHVKKSFGSAMKFVGRGWWPNFTCYAKLAVLTFFVLSDPSVIQQISAGHGSQVAQNLGRMVKDQFDSAIAKTGAKSSGDTASPAPTSANVVAQSPSNTMVPVNSATQPPRFAWPAGSTAESSMATSSTAAFTASHPSLVPVTARGAVPANPPSDAGFPSSASRRSNVSSTPNDAGQSAPASGGRFWQ